MKNKKEASLTLNNKLEKPLLGVPPALEMDAADYLPDMEEFNMTEAEKIELLRVLWDVMRRFVEMNIDIGEADPCGQIFGNGKEIPTAESDDVKSSIPRDMEMQADDEKEGYPA